MDIQPEQHRTALVEDLFSHVQLRIPDQVQSIYHTFIKDPRPDKISLGIGIYRDDDDKPYLFKAVHQAEERILKQDLNKDYLHTLGLSLFRTQARKLIFGDCPAVQEGRVASIQTISGSGAMEVGFDFLKLFLFRPVYISNLSWPVHKNMANFFGFTSIGYPYFNFMTLEKEIPAMMDCLLKADEGSIVILQPCAHNPTGADPTEEEWKQIAALMKQKKLVPFFDCAYQGFASGDTEKDVWPIRYFVEQGFQMLVAQSFSKNMGLYGERVGALHIVAHNQGTATKILSQIQQIIGNKYSTPPIHGALIVQTILSDDKLKQKWLTELRDVVFKRISDMRAALRNELESLQVPGEWYKMSSRLGMFFYSGLSREQCEILTNKHHIYLPKSGRISLTGVNTKNVKRIAQAIKSVIAQQPAKTQ